MRSYAKYPPFRASADPNRCSMYDFDGVEARWHYSSLASRRLSCGTPPLADHILIQMPRFDQLFQVILEHPALLGGVLLISMIGAVQILVPLG